MKTILLLCFVLIMLASDITAQKIEVIREGDKVFLLNKSSAKPEKKQYNYIYPCSFSNDFLIAEKGEFFLADMLTGKITELDESFENLKINNDTSNITNDNLLRFREKNKIGLMRIPDKSVLPPEYSAIYPKAKERTFFFIVKGKNWQIFFPQTGKFTIIFQEINGTDLYLDNGLSYLEDNNVFLVKSGENIHLMRTDGTDFTLDKSYSKDKNFSLSGNTLFLCIKDGKFGFVDEFGNNEIPFKLEWAEPMNGNAIVKENGKFGLIKENGSQTIPCVYDKLERAEYENFKGTKNGKTIALLESGDLYEYLMQKEDNGKYGYISEDNKYQIPVQFEAVNYFKNGLAAVKKDGKWGYIIPTGDLIIPAQFEVARDFISSGMAAVKINGKWAVIDFYGNYVAKPLYDSVQQVTDYAFRLSNNSGVCELTGDKNIKLVSISSEKGDFSDSRDGKTYKTVKIGNQTWMAQNIDFKTDESYYYDNNESNGPLYGRLYTWKAALKACPQGWHLPSDDDWKILERSLGMPENEVNSTDYNRGEKEAPMFLPGGSTGFDVQWSGFLHGYDNNFYKLGTNCILWTSTPNGTEYAYTRSFFPATDMINRDNRMYVKYALPVRCVKD